MNGALQPAVFDPSILAGLVLYLLVILGVGVWTFRYMRSLDDFVLGGRRLGPWVTAVSERASGESAWFLLGLPGAAYALGFREFWSVIGIAFGILASWALIAVPLRRGTARIGAITIPDYFSLRFQERKPVLRILSTVITLVFYTAYVGAQFIGAGKILEATFGLKATWGMILGAVVVVFYTFMGGFLAVAWTDLFQGVLMAVVVVVLPVVGLIALGGPNAAIAAVTAKGSELLSMSGGKMGRALVFGVVLGSLSWGFGYLGQPHLLTRYMAIRKASQLKKSGMIAMGWVLIAYWGAVFVGLIGIGVLGPNLEDSEQVMPLLAKALVPGWIAGLMIAGAIAAMMSTADSQLLVATSSLIEDVYARMIAPGKPQRHLVLMSRLATVAIAGAALLLAFTSQDVIYDLVAYAWSGLGASFGPPLLLSLRWKRTTRYGVLCGMLGGASSAILWKNLPALNELIDLKFASFAISLVLTVAASLAGGKASLPERDAHPKP